MPADCLLNRQANFLLRISAGDASRQIRNVCTEAAVRRLFNDNSVFHGHLTSIRLALRHSAECPVARPWLIFRPPELSRSRVWLDDETACDSLRRVPNT